MRELIVRFLNFVIRDSGPDAYEWTNQQIVFFTILWPASLAAGALFVYGLYENSFRGNEEGFRYLAAGWVALLVLGLLATFISRFLKQSS